MVEEAIAGAVRGAVTAAVDAASNFLANVYDWARCKLYPGACEAERQLGAYTAAAKALWDDVQANVGTNPLLAVALAMALRQLHEMMPFSGWKHLKASWSTPWVIRADAIISANKSRARAEAREAVATSAAGRVSKYVQKAPLGVTRSARSFVASSSGSMGAGVAVLAAAVALAVFAGSR